MKTFVAIAVAVVVVLAGFGMAHAQFPGSGGPGGQYPQYPQNPQYPGPSHPAPSMPDAHALVGIWVSSAPIQTPQGQMFLAWQFDAQGNMLWVNVSPQGQVLNRVQGRYHYANGVLTMELNGQRMTGPMTASQNGFAVQFTEGRVDFVRYRG